jgi:hypothetical protein
MKMVALNNNLYFGYPQTVPPTPPVAKNETSFIWGDPHINDPDGGTYQISASGKFNLLQDTGVDIKGDFGVWQPKSTATVMRDVDLTIDGKKIHIDANGKTTMDGNELKDQTFTSWGNGDQISKLRNGIVSIHTAEYDILIGSEATKGNAQNKFLNLSVTTGEKGVSADGKAPTGLLGETFDADTTKQTQAKQNIENYRSTNTPPVPTPSQDPFQAIIKLFQQLLNMMMQLFQ